MKILIPCTDRLLQLPNQNVRTLMDAFASFAETRHIEVRRIPENEIPNHDDVDVLLSMRTLGLRAPEALDHCRRHGIRIVAWHDDVVSYRFRLPIAWVPRNSFTLRLMEMADLVFLPSYHQAMRFRSYRRHRHKCVWLPWSMPDDYFAAPPVPWEQRKDAVILAGRISWQYALRTRVHAYAARHPDLKVDILEHPSYDTASPLHTITGRRFVERLGQYKYAVATTAMDYIVAKYLEIPAAGCLMLAEPVPDLERMGFRAGEHFRVMDSRNYRELLRCPSRDGDARIARAGYELVRARHVHSLRVRQMMDAIQARHENGWRPLPPGEQEPA